MSKATPKVLQAEDVTITTASVSIKTVTVNNRQMTQSLFRQLEPTNFIDFDACEVSNGVIWGYVNYMSDGGVRQFLVQSGSRLYRCPFFIRRLPQYYEMHLKKSQTFNRLLAAYEQTLEDYAKVWLAHEVIAGRRKKNGERFNDDSFKVSFDDGFGHYAFSIEPEWLEEETASADGDLLRGPHATKGRWSKEENQWIYEDRFIYLDVAKVRQDIVKVAGRFPSVDDVLAPLCRDKRALNDYCSRWNALMDKLDGVEQLFISA